MPKIAATIIDNITNSVVTADGDHMVLTLHVKDGGDLSLAIDRGQLQSLVDHAALAMSESEKILRTGRDGGVPVGWWNSAVDRNSGEFTLAVTFGGGGRLSFDFSEHMARALLATLRAHYPAEAGARNGSVGAGGSATEHFAPGFVDTD